MAEDNIHFRHRTGQNQTGTDLEAPLREPSFIVFGGSMEAANEAKQSVVISICEAREPQKMTSQERQTQGGNKLNTSLR